jgi:hypothetical protein
MFSRRWIIGPDESIAGSLSSEVIVQSVEGFDYYPLHFDASGNLQGMLDELSQRAGSATDIIFLAHGFRNDEDDATGLYTRFLHNFRANLSRPELKGIAGRNYAVAAVFWPSKSFQESFQSAVGGVQAADPSSEEQAAVEQGLIALKSQVSADKQAALEKARLLISRLESDSIAQDQFTSLVLSVLDGINLGASEGVQEVRAQRGSEILAKLQLPIILPTQEVVSAADASGGVSGVGTVFSASDSDGGGATQGVGSFVGSILGAAGTFLNFTTWWVMKDRSGIVGANGVASAVRSLKTTHPALRIHLVGHSLGGRLMAGCAKSLAGDPMVQPDSVTLLEAAFSHFGFSKDCGDGQAGFFRDVIDKKVSKGPLVATFSAMDTVVGHVYALASRVAGDNVKAIGDENDPFGGIGRNGAQKTAESVKERLHDAGDPYVFKTAVVNNLDGSANLITSHGDVTNERVTYAFASVVAAT